MKKLCIFLTLLTLLAVIAGCAPKEQDKDLGEPSKVEILSKDWSEYFSNLDEFKSYINNKEKQSKHCPIDYGVYVDFSSILPDSEIEEIAARYHNWYSVRYAVKNDSILYGLSIDFITTPTREKYDYNVEEMIKSGALNETSLKSISEIEDYKATTAYTWVEIGEYTLFYYTYLHSNPDKFDNFDVIINGYQINIQWNEKLSIDDYTHEQAAFLSALVPEYGATDDSVIAMLDKIKALIPSGNTAEDSYDYELDNIHGDASGDVSSNDGSSTTDQTSGETNENTDYGDDYLYEDNDTPTIPGISPDWKPNENGNTICSTGEQPNAECTCSTVCENSTANNLETFHHKNICNIFHRIPEPNVNQNLNVFFTGHNICHDTGNGHNVGYVRGISNRGIGCATIATNYLDYSDFAIAEREKRIVASMAHEIGHLFQNLGTTLDHNTSNSPSNSSPYCIYGSYKDSDSSVYSNIKICSYCTSIVKNNASIYDHR